MRLAGMMLPGNGCRTTRAPTFEGVRAALERHVYDGARRVAVGRVEAGRADLELLHCARRRHERHAPAARHVRRSVERELVAAARAVGVDPGGAGIVEGAR